MRISLITLLYVFISFLVSTGTANACSCSISPTVYQEFSNSDAVFIGKAVSSRDSSFTESEPAGFGNTERFYSFEVATNYKGTDSHITEASAGNINSSCYGGFALGKTYLIYASKNKKGGGLIARSSCGLIDLVESSKFQISIIDGILKHQPESQIYGSLKYTDENDDEMVLVNTRVLLKSGKKTFTAITDENGGFRFQKIPEGNYMIQPVLPTGPKVDFADTQAIVVTKGGKIYTENFADDIKDLVENFEDSKSENGNKQLLSALPRSVYTDFYVAPDYAVQGQVFDSEGKPSKCSKVSLVNLNTLDKIGDPSKASRYIIMQLGEDRLSAWAWCKDDGSFKVSVNKSGKYVLGAELDVFRDDYIIFFQPQSISFKSAEIIEFTKPTILTIDIELPKLPLKKGLIFL